MSDGCSVPHWLRWLLPEEPPAQTCVCMAHDRAYWYGGTRADRRRADDALRNGLIHAGMSKTKADLYYAAVRVFGAPPWHLISPHAWAKGDGRYCYDEE